MRALLYFCSTKSSSFLKERAIVIVIVFLIPISSSLAQEDDVETIMTSPPTIFHKPPYPPGPFPYLFPPKVSLGGNGFDAPQSGGISQGYGVNASNGYKARPRPIAPPRH